MNAKAAEEGDREPEEVQGRQVVRPAETDRGANHHREDADERERIVEPLPDGRCRVELDDNRKVRGISCHGVGERLPGATLREARDDVSDILNRSATDRQEDISRP